MQLGRARARSLRLDGRCTNARSVLEWGGKVWLVSFRPDRPETGVCVCVSVCVFVCARLQYGKVHLKGRSLEPRREVNWEFSVCRVINLLHLRGFRFRVHVDAAQVR